MIWWLYVKWALYALGGLVLLFNAFFTVKQQVAWSIERFGKFVRMAHAGLNFKIPFIERRVYSLNLRVLQFEVKVETKTRDNVFVTVMVSVQYQAIRDRARDAIYRLQNPQAQIESYVLDVVRARVPAIPLDNVFDRKDEIADAVKTMLQETMAGYGYAIIQALVTDIDPAENVKAAMNAMEAAKREAVAAVSLGEAKRVFAVKEAEAEARSKELQGQGMAAQRREIARGLQDQIRMLREAGIDPHEATRVMFVTQWLDTLAHIGGSSRTNTILLPHGPGSLNELVQQFGAMALATKSEEPSTTQEA